MKPETISMAIGYIDNELIEAADALRNRKKANNHWKRWAALAACLCLIVGSAITFLRGFPIGVGNGNFLGVLIDGEYYYTTTFSFYRYTPSTQERERIMSRFNVKDIGWRVNEHGLYYIKGRSLYVREHETGVSHRLYTANMNTTIGFADGAGAERLKSGYINLRIFDSNRRNIYPMRVIQIDAKTGEIIWQGEVSQEEWTAIFYSGNIRFEFPVGGHVYRNIMVGSFTDGYFYKLHRDEQPFITPPEGMFISFEFEYVESSLLIRHRLYAQMQDVNMINRTIDEVYLLATPDGEVIPVPHTGRFLTGTDKLLLFSVFNEHTGVTTIHHFDVSSREMVLLHNTNLYFDTAVTDGAWLFANILNGRTDCWKLLYDEAEKLVGLELWDAAIN
jgi:hypothetical protein